MPLGPVFDAELVTTARRGRYYALRFAYGMILLGLVAARYSGLERQYEAALRVPNHQVMASFAQGLFWVFNSVQAVAILVMTPALAAGAIADERQRKTLHYLLASELSGAEIVLGKLAARLLHAMVFVVAGLPVIGLLGLFGGIEPIQVALSFAGAASTAFFLAALSVFVSAIARRAREAVVMAYVLELAWLFLPWVLGWLVSGWERGYRIFGPVNAWVTDSGPSALAGLGPGFDAEAVRRLGWMIGLQVTYGWIFVAMATWRLRPSDRAVAEPAAGGRRWLARPIGEDPMLWKECRVARSGGPLRAVWVGLGLMALASLGYLVAGSARGAFEELAQHGYGRGSPAECRARDDLTALLKIATVAVSFAWTLAVATSAASGLTTEREDDTWLSLVGTPLEGREILRAKRVGAFLRPKGLLLTLLALWSVGLAAGALHPVGVAGLLAASLATGAFSASLGTRASLRSKGTARAMAATLAVLLALDVGAVVCGEILHPYSDILYGFSSPVLFNNACLGYQDARQVFARELWGSQFTREAAVCLAGVMAYATAAWILARWADRSFDRAVDRPRRPRPARRGADRAG